jgi:hypothetical protein
LNNVVSAKLFCLKVDDTLDMNKRIFLVAPSTIWHKINIVLQDLNDIVYLAIINAVPNRIIFE